MIITVKDALNIWPLTLGEVIAGKNGLNRVIKSVSVLEVPKETKWFKGGELQISAFYAVANDEKSQLEVLRNLNSKNCSGLVLCHIGHWLKSISEAFINLADELKFPIIVVPEHLAYIDIITPIMNVILNKKRTDDRYALEIYRKMTSMLLDKKNIDHIVYMLSKSLNTTVLFFNSSNECMTTGHKEVSPSFINEIKGNILINLSEFNNDNEYIKVFSKLTGIIILLAPVIINKRYYGTITIFNKSDLNDLEMQTIAETKYACGLAVIESTRLEE
ncbi:PucR family transcriptional regulator ligand-binding domain-containing protein, partial [Lutispora sp.]|uniref:PucR family transcriptional regulator ligand-binding domain-containing protein n=1 Tax=Lutispora sp. TaxID=2828727 RepID=UPI002B212D2B